MIELAEFKAFEEPTIFVKLSHSRQAAAVQRWSLGLADADVLFSTLCLLLDGSKEIGPILFKRDAKKGKATVIVSWKPADAIAREELIRKSTGLEFFDKAARYIVDHPDEAPFSLIEEGEMTTLMTGANVPAYA